MMKLTKYLVGGRDKGELRPGGQGPMEEEEEVGSTQRKDAIALAVILIDNAMENRI